jgi:hypothetical protein
MTKSEMVKVMSGMPKRQARAMLERVCPHQFKARRVRNIVRRTMAKSKTKEFTEKLDALLAAIDSVHDLDQQQTAMNPRLTEAQRDGSIARKQNEALHHLLLTWEGLTALV